jgi:putative phosphoribosyl transferase
MHKISINCNSEVLEGDLSISQDAKGMVIFAHGSGSSRYSPRNRYVARTLHNNGLATLLFDLLTKEEEDEDRWTGHLRFNIPLLATRLISITDWLKKSQQTGNLKIGYFGASTGAAAALVAAAKRTTIVEAVVSRGGRPDLAGAELEQVRASTLLIVGGSDEIVLDLNRKAFKDLRRVKNKKIKIVPGATHLFEEPGALEEVAKLATNWFLTHLK